MPQTVVRYQRNPDFVFRKIVDELVLVPIHQNVADMDSIYTLNAVGADLWERLERPATQADLEEVILEAYEAEPHVVATDVASFLRELSSFGAIREV